MAWQIPPQRLDAFGRGCSREEIRLSLEDSHARRTASQQPPVGPWGAPAPEPPDQPPQRAGHAGGSKGTRFSSIAFFVLMVSLVGAGAYKDLSRPAAWAYWKDLYF